LHKLGQPDRSRQARSHGATARVRKRNSAAARCGVHSCVHGVPAMTMLSGVLFVGAELDAQSFAVACASTETPPVPVEQVLFSATLILRRMFHRATQ